jgi:hypothetical protein
LRAGTPAFVDGRIAGAAVNNDGKKISRRVDVLARCGRDITLLVDAGSPNLFGRTHIHYLAGQPDSESATGGDQSNILRA